MALFACKECGSQVSDQAANCPKCGAPVAPQLAKVAPASATVFKHPSTGETADIKGSWVWVLLFGCAFFAYKGVWTHAVASLILAIATAGFSWLLYPFFARAALRGHYVAKGWVASS